MKRLAGGLGMLVLSVGCTVESDSPPVPPPTSGRICSAVLSTSGTFAPDEENPRMDEGTGCWPYGTWTFSAKVESNDCDVAPQPLSEYQIRVHFSLDDLGDPTPIYEYLTEPNVRHTVKVSQGGSGLCYSELLTYSDDGTEVWLLKPTLHENNALMGDGEYNIYAEDQWDEPEEP